jgi:hypothetical protein
MSAEVTQVCVFEDLKSVAAQLAGFLVLEASGARTDPQLLVSAEQVYRNAVDGLRSARKPERHLLAAASKLDAALCEMRTRRDALPLLESAYADLRAAARAIPGLQMIAFEQGCCA